MNDRLRGKVAIITGAGRHKGLGEAIARRFASESCDVVLTDIGAPSGPHLPADNIGSSAEMESVAEGIRAHVKSIGGAARILTMVCDVRSEADVQHVRSPTPWRSWAGSTSS